MTAQGPELRALADTLRQAADRNLPTVSVSPIVAHKIISALERAAAAEGEKAEAWDEGVATALNNAIRNDDGVTLRLEHLDGRPWINPYRSAS